jgi:HlyD family secretion protein
MYLRHLFIGTFFLVLPVFIVILVSSLLLACKEAPAVSTVPVITATVDKIVTSVNAGTVKARSAAELSFGSAGRVKGVYVDTDDFVKKGQILAEVENADLLTSVEFQRSLLKRQLIAQQNGGLAEIEIENSRQSLAMAEMAYEKTLIRAPFDGVIVELNLEVGQLSQITAINPQALIRIVDREPRYIVADIDEADLADIKVGQLARVRLMALGRDDLKARVVKIIRFVNSTREQERTVEVELVVEEEALDLPIGASVDVDIIVASHKDVLATNSRAVLGQANGRYVFKIHKGRLVKVPVVTGFSDYKITEIGIPEGASDVYKLQKGDEVCLPDDEFEFLDGMQVGLKR